MNEKLLKYLNELSASEAKAIANSVARSAKPEAKAFWSRIASFKRAGWNEAIAMRMADEAMKYNPDDLAVGRVSKDIFTQDQTKPSGNRTERTSMTGGMNKYSFDRQVPSPDEIPLPNQVVESARETVGIEEPQPVSQPSRASYLANSTNTSNKGDNASNQPKNASERTRTDIDGLPSAERDSMGLDTEFLRNLGLDSLKKTAENWESMKASNAESVSADSLARREKLNYFLQDAQEVIGPLRSVFDFVEQRREEKQAGRIADRAMRQAPTPPGVRGENQILSNLIRNSQIAYSNPQQMIQPYMDQVNLGYQQDLSMAQEASGGQAGNMAGMSQAAAIRRNQANMQGAGIASDVFREGLATTGALVGQQMQDDTWRDQQNIDLFKTANANNQDLQRQAGMGLASSRARSIQARNNMLDSMLQSPVFDVDTYMGYTRKNLTNPPQI